MSGALDHSPADVIRCLLIDLGHGTTPSASSAWPIYVSIEPDTPDSVITVYDTSGVLHGRSQISGEMFEHPGIQIRIRSPEHPAGYRKADSIKEALDKSIKYTGVTVEDQVGTGSGNYLVYSVSRKGSVNDLGRDTAASKRHVFTINATIALKQTG